MADYPLAQLGAIEFEQLVQALAEKVLGPGLRIYGLGRDGGRDLSALTPIPAPDGSATWTGQTVVQIKFRMRPQTPADNARWLRGQMQAELESWARRLARGIAAPENMLFATNAVLSGVPGSGLDLLDTVIDAIRERLGVSRVAIWHYDHVCRLLDDAADIRAAYPALLTIADVLGERGRTPSPPRMAPAPPAHFVTRTRECQALLSALLDNHSEEPTVGLVAATAVHGTGGYGKTSLAAWACHQPEILAAFPDGVLWVELGRDPQPERLVNLLADLEALLSGHPPRVFSSVPAAAAAFAAATRHRRALVVVDDAWRSQDLEPFLGGEPACRRLVTTRRTVSLPAGGVRIAVDMMTPAQATAVLGAGLAGPAQPELLALYERSGRWPLVLALLNGVVRSMLARSSLTIPEVVEQLVERLDRFGAAGLDDIADDGQKTIAGTLELSLTELELTAGRTRTHQLLTLATFPEGTLISYDLLDAAWAGDRLAVHHACDQLEDRSLLAGRSSAGVRVHDEIRDYLRRSRHPAIAAAHAGIVDAIRGRCPEGWHTVHDAFPTAAEDLAFQLVNAGYEDELRDALRDLRYHAARLRHAGPSGLATDVEICSTAFARDPFLGALARSVALEAHLTLDVSQLRDVAATWYSRLIGHTDLVGSIAEAGGLLEHALVACRRFPDIPDPRLRRVLHGHTGPINVVCWRSDGACLFSASADGTIRQWDAYSGRQLNVLRLPSKAPLTALDVSHDGVYVLAGAEGVVGLFDAVEGETLAVVDVPGPVHCLRFAPTSSYALAGTGTQLMTLLLEDLRVGIAIEQPARCIAFAGPDLVVASGLAGELLSLSVGPRRLEAGARAQTDLSSVRDICLRPQGDVLAEVGAGDNVALVTADPPTVVAHSAPHTVGRNACDWSPDGETLAVGTADGHIDFWTDPARAAVHFMPDTPLRDAWESQLGAGPVLEYHGVFINDVAWQPAGDLLAVAASSPVVRIWSDLASEPPASTPGGLYDVAWQPGGRLIAAGGLEGELHVASSVTEDTWSRAGHDRQVRSVAWSPDGALVASHGEDGLLIMWRIDPEPVAVASVRLSDAWPGPVAWSPTADHLVVASGSRLMLLDAKDPKLRQLKAIDVGAHVASLAFTAAADQLVVGTADTELVRVSMCDDVVHRHESHATPIAEVRVASTGEVISCGHRGDVRRWNPDGWTSEPYAQLPTDAVWSMDISSDGSALVAAGSGGIALLATPQQSAMPARLKVDSALTACSLSTDATHVAFGGRAGLYVCSIGWQE